MEIYWFESWKSLFRIICVTPLAYVAIVFILRVSGKRTLSKMNAFDFVVTIALGTVLASVSLNQNIPLTNGIVAFTSFVVLQFIFTWLSARVKAVRTLLTSSPSLLFYRGKFIMKTMKKERVSVEEIYSAARQKDISCLDHIEMVILETTGDIAIVKKLTPCKTHTIDDVEMPSSLPLS